MKDEKQEIEILPPGEDLYAENSSRIWVSTNGGEVKFIKLGPFGAFMLAAGTLAVLGMGFFFRYQPVFHSSPDHRDFGCWRLSFRLGRHGPF